MVPQAQAILCRGWCLTVTFSAVTSGVTESREVSEPEKPLLANSLLKSFSGFKADNTPLAFTWCLMLAALYCGVGSRSVSASAIRILMQARSPFKAVKSWCIVSQVTSPVADGVWLPLLASGRLISSPYSDCWLLLGWSLRRTPPFTAFLTWSKNKTCEHRNK